MKYIKIGVFGAKDFKNAVKICVHSSRDRACTKKLQNCVQNTCCVSIYMFLGSISKMQPKLSYTCPGPMHMQKKILKCVQNTCCVSPMHMQKKNLKMCAKYMLCIDLYVFGVHFIFKLLRNCLLSLQLSQMFEQLRPMASVLNISDMFLFNL